MVDNLKKVAPGSPEAAGSGEVDVHRKGREIAEAFFCQTTKPVAVLDRDWRILRVNDSCARRFGRSAEELAGCPHSDLFPGEGWENVLQSAIRGRRPVQVITDRSDNPASLDEKPAAPIQYSNWTAEPVLDAQGQLQFLLLSCADVTQPMRRLEAALADLESFGYSISHDLRAPLRAIDNFSHILLEEYASTFDEEGRRLFNVVLKNTAAMRALIDGILSYARAARRTLIRSDVNLEALTRELLEELKPSIGERRIETHIAAASRVRADAAALREVLSNLLSNAIKFTRPRPVARIEITAQATGSEVICSIRDNGVGYEPQYGHKLFGLFQRLHDTEEFEGIGIGLCIVKRLIEAHGGRVWAEATPDAGATFFFSLPVSDNPAAAWSAS